MPDKTDNDHNLKFGIILIVILLVILIAIFGLYSWRNKSSSLNSEQTATEQKPSLIDKLLGQSSDNSVALTDADADGLSDKAEIDFKTNAAKADTDDDGLTDREEEMVYKTNPLVADTDGDGMNDGQEIKNRRNPLDANPTATWPPAPTNFSQ